MKKIAYLALAAAAMFAGGCEKDDNNGGIPANTWSFRPDGFEAGSYRTKTATLNVQGYQVFQADSEDNSGGGNNGIASTVKFFFKNVNPSPTGTYKVVDYDNLENEDEVAVYYQVYGDPRLGSQAYFFSHDDANATISYTFEDGKASVTCADVPLHQTGTGPAVGYLSANISQ